MRKSECMSPPVTACVQVRKILKEICRKCVQYQFMSRKSNHLIYHSLETLIATYVYLAHHPVVAQVKFGTEDPKQMRNRQYFKVNNWCWYWLEKDFKLHFSYAWSTHYDSFPMLFCIFSYPSVIYSVASKWICNNNSYQMMKVTHYFNLNLFWLK